LFRITQEATNNALKHGKAKRVVIALKPEGDKIKLTVTDNGKGFNHPPDKKNSGMGLHIMKYRAGMVGAALEVHSSGDTGTIVTCIFGGNL
jgi:signal transduction histidine kinase